MEKASAGCVSHRRRPATTAQTIASRSRKVRGISLTTLGFSKRRTQGRQTGQCAARHAAQQHLCTATAPHQVSRRSLVTATARRSPPRRAIPAPTAHFVPRRQAVNVAERLGPRPGFAHKLPQWRAFRIAVPVGATPAEQRRRCEIRSFSLCRRCRLTPCGATTQTVFADRCLHCICFTQTTDGAELRPAFPPWRAIPAPTAPRRGGGAVAVASAQSLPWGPATRAAEGSCR